APKTASAPTTMPMILFDRAILLRNMFPPAGASILELARGILSERFADRLGLTQFEAVHADFEHRAALLHDEAAPGPRRAREKHVERVVSDAGDGFGRDYLARLPSVELVNRTLAGARLIDGERDGFALA